MSRITEPWRISIDTGGTFTDCLAVSPAGKSKRLKILSSSLLRGTVVSKESPNKLRISAKWTFDGKILEGYYLSLGKGRASILKCTENGRLLHLKEDPDVVEGMPFEIRSEEEVPVFACRLLTATPLNQPLPPIELRLGTTRGTNALLERKGARVLFLVTRGFGDLLRIRDQRRPNLFALNIERPAVIHSLTIEVEERMDSHGKVIIPLTEKECERIATIIREEGGDQSVAVAFMHSYKNPAHENQLADHLKKTGVDAVSCSADLSSNSGFLARAETTVVNAYLQPVMSNYLKDLETRTGAGVQVMTSAGSLMDIGSFYPKDGLLSGPAGGVKGSASIGRRSGYERLISFDMGGTSTDVSLYDHQEDFTFETTVGPAVIQAPGLAIETIAAGGGSICHYTNKLLQTGPESAGAEPGPACYGQGGPLTLTDVNLLCGRISETDFAIPLHRQAAEKALSILLEKVRQQHPSMTERMLLTSLLRLANEKMARSIGQIAIRKGENASGFTLVAFGGAGGQHACDLAEELTIHRILAPFDGGVLSAFGIQSSEQARFQEKEISRLYAGMREELPNEFRQLIESSSLKLEDLGHKRDEMYVRKQLIYLRYTGQETAIELPYNDHEDLYDSFRQAYEKIYGHTIEDLDPEVASIKVQVAIRQPGLSDLPMVDSSRQPTPQRHVLQLNEEETLKAGVFQWESLKPGDVLSGPALLTSDNSTVVIKPGWEAILDGQLNARLEFKEKVAHKRKNLESSSGLALFSQRFLAVVENMGAQLQRTSFSVNIKERVDFSCALLDSQGYLVMNAPHIPVHLGSMGICVRSVIRELTLEEGDMAITNHPAYGGSHLPDVTLISPVFYEGNCVAYIANRAHHAEIGGVVPGSMPPHATALEEEGVILPPSLLMKKGKLDLESVKQQLLEAKFPTRSVTENLADLRGALASIQKGLQEVRALCEKFGPDEIIHYMAVLHDYGADRIQVKLNALSGKKIKAEEFLDDGSRLTVQIDVSEGAANIDFTGSADIHPGNLNATPAIVHGVILYIWRLVLDEDFPLNEGMLTNTKISLPKGLLNPDFRHLDPMPAVAGGNTEVSQRLTDTLLKALRLAACSQGTMNNLIFGNERFGYYETIGGGTGAGDGFHGTDAVHQHMTNTRITDPEILELRYPVRLQEFRIRKNSGGKGKWKGGNGIVRSILFLEPVQLSLLGQHRKERPYGLEGGKKGKAGKQYLISKEGQRQNLHGMDSIHCEEGTTVVVKTPGGGGYGIAGQEDLSDG